MDLNNLILFFFLIGFNLLFYKYFLLILYKYNSKILLDDQFNKPQAFHDSSISISGGTIIFCSSLIIILNFWLFKNIVFFEYLSICSLFFAVGFIDDIRINIKPIVRLILMIFFLIFLITYNNLYIEKTGIDFLDQWLNNSELFSLIFISLCFLFIINGANLIDGYNGLLGFHSLIILLNLFFINYFNGFNDLANFLFFEVFFSFFRKIIKEKSSPIYPDGKHLHMLLYKLLLKKNNNKLKSNYYVAIVINIVYLVLMAPVILMMDNGLFCKYYSILLFGVYIFSYKITNAQIK